MKKLLIVLALVFGSFSQVYALQFDGERIYGINFCSKVDRYDVTKYKGLQFVNTGSSATYLYKYSESYRAVMTVMVGYKSMIMERGLYNSRDIGTVTHTFYCPGSYSNQTDTDFTAGRVTEWLIPEEHYNGGGTVTVTMDGHTISTTNIQE